ncbi:hypothetical protein OQA88_819 [Cercophora sp. LCS_1]
MSVLSRQVIRATNYARDTAGDDSLYYYGEYASHIQRNSIRVLTNQDDAIMAAAGVTRRFSEIMECEMLEGLPVTALEAFILFKGHNLRRRNNFPSYSWAGWIGEVKMENTGPSFGPPVRWISWYQVAPASRVAKLTIDPATHRVDTIAFSFTYAEPTKVFDTCALDVFEQSARLIGSGSIDCGEIQFNDHEAITGADGHGLLELILITKNGFGCFHAILIEWVEGVAERRGIGTITPDGLKYRLPPGPLWKEIILR